MPRYLTYISQMNQQEDTGDATLLRMRLIWDPLSYLINSFGHCVICLLSFGCLATANNGSMAAVNARSLCQCLSSSLAEEL